MKTKRFSSWYKGLFRKERTEARISDEALLKINNGDIDISGRISIRPGYEHWDDLDGNDSVAASDGEPDISSALIDFQNKVQGMYHFTDVAGVQYIFVVTDGKVYAEMPDGDNKVWILLNPIGIINFVAERAKEIKMVSYLDTVFFNDFEQNIYMYNSQQYNEGGWIITGNRFIYFAGEKIYIRSYADFSSTSEDITIENVAANLNGKIIYDSLVAISFVPGEVSLANVNFGYAIKVGDAATGYNYYVLSNGKTPAAGNKCYIVKLNERFIAKDFLALNTDAAAEIINFGYYDDNLYVWCKDGEFNKIDVSGGSMSGSVVNTGDITAMVAPSPDGGTTKQYAITANDEGVFLYSVELPDKFDWWQPIIFEDFDFDDSTDSGFTFDMSGVIPQNNDVAIGKNLLNQDNVNINNDFYDGIDPNVGANKYFIFEVSNAPYGRYFHSISSIQIDKNGAYRVKKVISDGSNPPSAFSTHIRDNRFSSRPWWRTPFWDTQDVMGNAPIGNDQWEHNRGNLFIKKEISQFNIIEFLSSVDLLPTSEEETAWTTYITQINGNDASFYEDLPWSQAVGTGYYWYNGIENPSSYHLSDGIPIAHSITLENANFDLTKRKVSPNQLFAYDKDNAHLADIVLWSNYDGRYLTLSTNNFFYLKDATYNSGVFSSKTVSDYVLLVGLDSSGNFLSKNLAGVSGDKTWRWILPLGKITELKNVLPLQFFKSNNDEITIYFGTSMDDGTNGQDNGRYMSLNMTTYQLDSIELKKADKMMLLQSDFLNRWWMRQLADSKDQLRIGDTWSWDQGIHQHPSGIAANDYIDLFNFNSNLIFHVLKIIQDTPLVEIDQLKPLGVPKTPQITMDNDDLNDTSTFTKDDTYRYYLAYQFLDGSTTDLSPVSEEFVIPDLGVPGAEPVKIVLSNLNLKNAQGIQIYAIADIDEIQIYRAKKPDGETEFADPVFLAKLEKDGNNDWYYNEAEQTFPNTDVNDDGGGDLEVTLAAHGYIDGDIVRFSSTGTLPTGLAIDTNYYIVNKAAGTFEISLTSGGTPIAYTDQGTGTHSVWLVYAEETYEDNVDPLTYNPFTRANVKTYPCKDIVVHKNRLVLINKTNEVNSNVLHYSDLDAAEALPPTNLRAIESGDGDLLTGGISVGDYLFLFKEFHIYAILGDVSTGQLVDVSRFIGTAFPRTIVTYNNIVYFINRTGVFRIIGPKVEEIKNGALDNIFDERFIDVIDFENCPDNAFGYVETKRQLIHFYIPRKVAGNSQTENNAAIIYDIHKNLFTTYTYHDNIFKKISAKNIITRQHTELMTNYLGNIFKIAQTFDDNGNETTFDIWLKSFNANIDIVRKYFKFIKVFGYNIEDITLKYDIDGIEQSADVTFRDVGAFEEGVAILKTPGFANRIIVKVSTTPPLTESELIEEESGDTMLTEQQQVLTLEQSAANFPVSFDEFLLGYEPLRGGLH